MHPVPRLDDEIALGDDQVVPALHRAEEHLGQMLVFAVHIAQGHAHHAVAFRGPEVRHFHLAPGEGLHHAGEGKAQHAADFPGGGAFGVDHIVDGQLLLQEGQGGQVFRIPDPGDGVLGPQALGRQAGKHIDLVAHGGGDDDIGVLHVRFPQRIHADAAAVNEHGVQGVLAALDHGVAAVDDGDVMAFGDQALGQGRAHLAAANH